MDYCSAGWDYRKRRMELRYDQGVYLEETPVRLKQFSLTKHVADLSFRIIAFWI